MWKKIEQMLTDRNWTIYRLAENAGLKPGVLYALRDGKSNDLMFDTVCKLADALGVSTEEFR